MQKPYFMWDYDLTTDQIKELLHSDNEVEKSWLTARILTHAHFDDVWEYLSVANIVKLFPKLYLKPEVKTAWKHALEVWGYNV